MASTWQSFSSLEKWIICVFVFVCLLAICLLVALIVVIRTHTDPTSNRSAHPVVRPRALSPNDTVAIIAPSGPVKQADIQPAIQGVRAMGYRVKAAPNLATPYGGFLAGNASWRAEIFMKFYRDPDVKALWCIRGGSGGAEILPLLDYDEIRKNPKIVIGMSDVTSLHGALTENAGIVSFYGPVLTTLFVGYIKPEDQTYSIKNAIEIIQQNYSQTFEYVYPQSWTPTPRVIVGGTGTGRLAGGTLSVLVSNMGTPFEVQTDGKILVIEDINEPIYKLNRYFDQLLLAGKLDRCAGVILGSCVRCNPSSPDRFTLDEIYDKFFQGVTYPVLVGFPVGHIDTQVTLPLGCMAKLDADNKKLQLIENCLEH